MGCIIFESRNILHASRNAITALTESYEQKLLAWYHAHENLKAEHKTTKAKLEEERQQLEIARKAIRFNESALAEYQKVRQNNQAQNRGNREMQQMKIALNKAEDRAKIAEEKEFELEEKTYWTRKHRKELAAADTLGNMAALEEEKADQIRGYRDSLSATCKERLQELDDNFQTPDIREFVRGSSASSPKIVSAPFFRKRERSETSQDMQQRSHKIRKEEGASKETDDCTIVVEMRGDSGQPFIG
jgi:hypothetical protein